MTWYAAYSDHRGVTRAVAGLTERGFKTYVPKETRWRRSRKGKERVEHPLLGRYMFVEAEEDQLWEVASTLGVAGFVGSGNTAREIPRSEVVALRIQEEQGMFDRTQVKRFQPVVGQVVKITRGPFTGYTAQVVQAMSTAAKVRVLLKAFGGGTMTLDVERLAAA